MICEKLIVYLMEFPAKNSISCLLSDLYGLHLWLNIKGDPRITRNLHIFLHFWVEVSRTVSIPEEGNVTKLDGLTVLEGKNSSYQI